jgi:hypothetical protein
MEFRTMPLAVLISMMQEDLNFDGDGVDVERLISMAIEVATRASFMMDGDDVDVATFDKAEYDTEPHSSPEVDVTCTPSKRTRSSLKRTRTTIG